MQMHFSYLLILEDPLGSPRILVGKLYDFGIILELLAWIRNGGRTSSTFTTFVATNH